MSFEVQDGSRSGGDSLGDALGTVLDKGLVITGDISIHLVKTELLTIKIRLILASVERAEKMGIDWWKRDAFLTAQPVQQISENPSETVSVAEPQEETETAGHRS